MNIARLLLQVGSGEHLIGTLNTLKTFHGPIATFRILQNDIYPPYETHPARERLALIETLKAGWHNVPALIEAALGKQGVSIDVVQASAYNGNTLLHIVCSGLFIHLHKSPSRCVDKPPSTNLYLDPDLDEFGWNHNDLEVLKTNNHVASFYYKLIAKCVSAGARLHAVNSNGDTPLSVMLNCDVEYHWRCDVGIRWITPSMKVRQEILRGWLKTLFSCGVDLQKYGETEKMYRAPTIQEYESRWHQGYTWHLACTGFTYGPHPEDWHFWFSDPTDHFVGKFWNRIENQMSLEDQDEPVLPGAWVDD
jgi:hypothetical protein